VFADLSPIHAGLFEPPPPTATPAERVVANLRGPASYSRRGRNGLYLKHLLVEDGSWHPSRDIAPLLDFSLGAETRDNCFAASCASMADLRAKLREFVARAAPSLAGTRCAVFLTTHGGYTRVTEPSADNPHCLGDYAVNGVTSESEDSRNVRDLLDAPWLAQNLVLPLARAAAVPGSGGQRGRLLWLHSTCFAPPILRVLASALKMGVPTTVFGGRGGGGGGGGDGGSGGGDGGSGGGDGGSGGGDGAPAPSLLLVTHWPLLSPVQDICSLLCADHGRKSMYGFINEKLRQLQTDLRMAENAPAASCTLRGVAGQLLVAFGKVDSSLGAMVCNFETRRSFVACVPWWASTAKGVQNAAGPPALLPPLPLVGARLARGKLEQQKHEIVVLDPQEEALNDQTPLPLEQLYTTAAAAGARSAKDLASEGAPPGEVLAIALLETARELKRGRTQFGSSSSTPVPAGSAEELVLREARAEWLASAIVYVPEGAAGDIAHRASCDLSVGLECLLAAVNARAEDSGGGGAAPASAPRPRAPWEMSLSAAHLISRTLLPLLDSLPFGTALIAHEKSLTEAAQCLAAARLLVEENAAIAAAATAQSSPMCEFVAQVNLASDLESPLRKFSDVPLRYRQTLVKAAMEVSATRWVGALCLLADLARFIRASAPDGAPSKSAAAWVDECRALAAGLLKIVDKFMLGDSAQRSPVEGWLRLLGQGSTLGSFEAALNADFVCAKTHSATPSPLSPGGPPAVAAVASLLTEPYERFLLAAPRAGGVYAWNTGVDEVL
jgi:hypothetical protein